MLLHRIVWRLAESQVLQQRVSLLTDVQVKADHPGRVTKCYFMHLDVRTPFHSAAQHRGAAWCRLEGMNLCSRRVIQQLVNRVAVMSADIQNRRRLNFSMDLPHGIVAIGHIEHFLHTVDDITVNAARHAITRQDVVKQAKHRGGL